MAQGAIRSAGGGRAGGHDIIVVGASAGGLEPLQRLLADLPHDLAASVFIVLHLGASSHLPEILSRSTNLPVSAAERGARIERGQIYVAIPDLHLLLHDGHLLLRRGPRENLVRPAIDALFRTAAATFGGHVIGVVLSGSLNDGTAGLSAIKRCGGLAVIQDPKDAQVPEMPLNAERYVEIDYSVPISAMGALLGRLAREPAAPTPEIPLQIRLEAAIAAQEFAGMETNDELGPLSPFTCPECHGTLWEIREGNFLRYRCHVGHALTAEVMLAAQAREAEELLWSLIRSYEERAELARRMAEYEESNGRNELAERMAERAGEYDQNASMLRRLVDTRMGAMAGNVPNETDC